MGHILAQKVNISRILRVMMALKCLGVKWHYVGNLLSNGTEKSACM